MSGAGVEPSRQDFAERLSQWLSPVDAVRLDAALHSIKALGAQASKAGPALKVSSTASADQECRRVKALLVKGIDASHKALADGSQANSTLFQPKATKEMDAQYAPYYQRYLDQQRQMELKVAPLRAHVRQVLSMASMTLRQLAALDAQLEAALGAREKKLLSTVPVFLEKRFEQLSAAHQQSLVATGQEDGAHLWRQPGGWLDVFGQQWRETLLAELDARLEPVVGLMEALSKEVGTQQ